ncbi:MAG TPA: OmpA family protein [Vicinamibacterales bacterium]|jgi:outer membrane protein OmpA-like peptidoglycan-associated protein
MSRLPLRVWLGGAFAAAVVATAAPASAAPPIQVRVLTDHPAKIQVSWFTSSLVLGEAAPGTLFDVLRRDGDFYWIILPPGGYGTRRGGWVRVDDVEPYDPAAAAAAAALLAARQQRGGAEGGAANGEGGTADDRVVITGRRDGTGPGKGNDGAGGANGAASGALNFEDLHFDLNGFSIHADDLERLRTIANALKADPTLVVNIEGHTCNLGTAAYNLALGKRRADAVKEYLVSAGIAAERLHAVSYGEKQPKYDNSKEETRQLNRRVAVVPEVKDPKDAKDPKDPVKH